MVFFTVADCKKVSKAIDRRHEYVALWNETSSKRNGLDKCIPCGTTIVSMSEEVWQINPDVGYIFHRTSGKL